MLKNIIQKGDQEYLDKLLSVYSSINDEKSIDRIKKTFLKFQGKSFKNQSSS